MKRSSPIAIMALWMALSHAGLLHGADAQPGMQVPAVIHTPKNYDEMIANIEATGLKVKIDRQLAKFMRAGEFSWASNSYDRGSGPTALTLRNFLDAETRDACLHCDLDKSPTVALTPAWRRDDDRSAGELLKAFRNAYEDLEGLPEKRNDKYSAKWLAPRKPCGLLLNALISKKGNYETGWRTMMLSLLNPDLGASWMVNSPDVILAGDFTDTSGKDSVLILVRHTTGLMPGHGGFSYYYFTPGGALVCSGLLSCSGGECFVTSASAKNGKEGAPSELAVKVRSVGYSENIVKKFAMEPGGLAHTELIRGNGTVITGDGMKNSPTVESLTGDVALAN